MGKYYEVVVQRVNGEVFGCLRNLLGLEIWGITDKSENHERTVSLIINIFALQSIKCECGRNFVTSYTSKHFQLFSSCFYILGQIETNYVAIYVLSNAP